MGRELVRSVCQRHGEEIAQVILVGDSAIKKAGILGTHSKTEIVLVSVEAQKVLDNLLDKQSKTTSPKKVVVFLNHVVCNEGSICQNLFARAKNLNIIVVATTELPGSLTREQQMYVDCLFVQDDHKMEELWTAYFRGWCNLEQFTKIFLGCTRNRFEHVMFNKSEPNVPFYYALPETTLDLKGPTPNKEPVIEAVTPTLQKLFEDIQDDCCPDLTKCQSFDMCTVPKSGVFICNGPSQCGKSTLANRLTRTLWESTNVCYVILIGDQAKCLQNQVPTYKPVLTLASNQEDGPLQKIIAHQSQAKVREHIVILMDPAPEILSSTHEKLFAEATNLNIAVVACTRTLTMTPEQFDHVDLVMSCCRNEQCTHYLLWQFFCHLWGLTFNRFSRLLANKESSQENAFIVFDKANSSTRYCIESCVSGPNFQNTKSQTTD